MVSFSTIDSFRAPASANQNVTVNAPRKKQQQTNKTNKKRNPTTGSLLFFFFFLFFFPQANTKATARKIV